MQGPDAKKSPAGVKKAFCETQFPMPGLEWLDDSGILPLAEGRFAKLELLSAGTVGEIRRIQVTVVSRETGKLDQKDFYFSDFLTEDPRERPSPNGGGLHVWSRAGTFDWYVAVPRSTAPITEAIGRYLQHFRQ